MMSAASMVKVSLRLGNLTGKVEIERSMGELFIFIMPDVFQFSVDRPDIVVKKPTGNDDHRQGDDHDDPDCVFPKWFGRFHELNWVVN